MANWRVTYAGNSVEVDADDEIEAVQEFFDTIAPDISVEPWPDDDEDDDDEPCADCGEATCVCDTGEWEPEP